MNRRKSRNHFHYACYKESQTSGFHSLDKTTHTPKSVVREETSFNKQKEERVMDTMKQVIDNIDNSDANFSGVFAGNAGVFVTHVNGDVNAVAHHDGDMTRGHHAQGHQSIVGRANSAQDLRRIISRSRWPVRGSGTVQTS